MEYGQDELALFQFCHWGSPEAVIVLKLCPSVSLEHLRNFF